MSEPHMDVDQEIRGVRACTACRIAKVRCLGPLEGACPRCKSAAIPCVFAPSRRGRIKGSKNKSTLQKEAAQRGEPLGDSRTISDRSGVSAGLSLHGNVSCASADPAGIAAQTNPSAFSGRPGADDHSGAASFPQRGLKQLEESFPTGLGRDAEDDERCQDPDEGFGSPEDASPLSNNRRQRDLQEPLLFLADCARRGWDADGVGERARAIPSPLTPLPAEDAARLQMWMGDAARGAIQDQRTFFQHGLYGLKRDVSAGLDAVQRKVITEAEVAPLFSSFFRHVHPHCPMLHPALHTPLFVRGRSAFLFAVILAEGAAAMATLAEASDADMTRACRLYAHAEKLHLVLCATAVKSVEIVQAQLLFVMWAQRTPRLVDDQRAIRLGMALRMAGMIGLQYSRGAKGLHRDDRMVKNDLRLRLCLILQESRWESLAERNTVSSTLFDLTDDEADILDATDPGDPEAILAADYALHRFEVESRERISRVTPTARSRISYDCERSWIKTFLENWDAKWAEPQSDPHQKWRFKMLSLQSWLVSILRLNKARTRAGLPVDRDHSDLYATALEMIKGCLALPDALHMLRPTSNLVFAATIIWQLADADSPERDLVLRLGLRLAGPPKDGQLMLFARHNGLQILNMLCLAKPPPRRAPVALKSSAPNDLYANDSQVDPATSDLLTTGLEDSWTDLDQLLAFDGNTDFPYVQNTALQMPVAITAPDEPASAATMWPQIGASGTVPWAAADAISSYQQPPLMLYDTRWLGGASIDSGAGVPSGSDAMAMGYGQDPWILQHLNAAFAS